MRQKRPIVAKILCGFLVCALVAGYSLPEVSAAEQEGQKTEEKSTEEVSDEQMSEKVSDTLDMQSLDEPEALEQIGPEGAEEENQGVSVISLPEGVESSGKCGDDVSYTLTEIEEGKYSLKITGSGPMNDYALRGNRAPWLQVNYQIAELTIDNGITSIGKHAFTNFRALTEVTLPDSVVRIEDNAFSGSSQLSKINLPAGLQKIGTSAFSLCDALDVVDIPGGVADWGNGQNFKNCNGLNTVRLSDGIQKIPPDMFNSCLSLETMEIPASVTEIGENAFYGCKVLTTIHFGGRSAEWSELLKTAVTGNEALSSEAVTVTYGYYKANFYCTAGLNLNIHAGDQTEKVAAGEGVDMYIQPGEKVTLEPEPEEHWVFTVFSIDGESSKEKEFEMPEKDIYITANSRSDFCGDDPYNEGKYEDLCWYLDLNEDGETYTLRIEGSGRMEYHHKQAGMGAAPWFHALDLQDIFQNAPEKVTSVVLPDGLTYISAYAFAGLSGLKEIQIPDSVENIGYWAFAATALQEVKLSAKLLKVNEEVYPGEDSGNDNEEIFWECVYLRRIEILETEEPVRIRVNALKNCTGLKEIVIPTCVNIIAKNAFDGTPILDTVYYRGTEEQWEELKANIDPDGNEAILNAKKIVYRYGWPEVTGSETNTDGSVTVTVSSIGSGDSFTEGELAEVTVDGKTVDPANYTLTGGKLTFLGSYMDTLKEGAHEIVLKYADGKEAAATITVTKTSSVNPQPSQGTGSGTGTGTGSGSAGGTGGTGTGNGTSAGNNNAGNGSSTAVQTGDPAQTGVWGALLLASLASIGYVASSRRRRSRSII